MTIARGALDTVWVRPRRTHQGTATGIGLGLAAAALIMLPRSAVQDGYRGHLALMAGLLLVGFGALGDVVAPPKWTPVPVVPPSRSPEDPHVTEPADSTSPAPTDTGP
jgi:hypothetical protein